MKEKVNRMVSWLGYLLLAIASNGIYLPSDNPGTTLIAWIIVGLIGAGILILKNLRFPVYVRGRIILADIIYLLILIGFGLIHLPR